MTETFIDFEARTGGTYAPPENLKKLGRTFESWEACPTLFRSPGPGGLRAWFEGTLERLAHEDAPLVWLSDNENSTSPAETAQFGALAILEPLHLQICKTRERGTFLGINPIIRTRTTPLGLGRDGMVWVPPSALGRGIRWAHVGTKRDAKGYFGPDLDSERSIVLDRINAYLAEVKALEEAGAVLGDVSWYATPAAERTQMLNTYGVTSRWTARVV